MVPFDTRQPTEEENELRQYIPEERAKGKRSGENKSGCLGPLIIILVPIIISTIARVAVQLPRLWP